jgi:hypothetical protein
VLGLLDKESSLVTQIDTQSPTDVAEINGQIHDVQAKILDIFNNDVILSSLTAGADGTIGFVALPPGTNGHDDGPSHHHGNDHLWG